VPIIRTLYLRGQGCEDRWLFFEAERDPRVKSVGNTDLEISFKLSVDNSASCRRFLHGTRCSYNYRPHYCLRLSSETFFPRMLTL